MGVVGSHVKRMCVCGDMEVFECVSVGVPVTLL